MDITSTIIMVVLLVGVFFLMYRSNKKQERETAQMRNSLEIGDEITTIGGIIGEIVRIKDETVTIETGKDRTKIRILRSAVRSVDVHAYEKRGDGKKPENAPETTDNKSGLTLEKKKMKKNKKNDVAETEAEAVETAEEAVEADTPSAEDNGENSEI